MTTLDKIMDLLNDRFGDYMSPAAYEDLKSDIEMILEEQAQAIPTPAGLNRSFEEYWNQYGELHASMCRGDIKMFAKEIWTSAIDSKVTATPKEVTK